MEGQAPLALPVVPVAPPGPLHLPFQPRRRCRTKRRDPMLPPRRRLRTKGPDPAAVPPPVLAEPVACLDQLPEDPMELRKMLKQFYYQLEKFRKGCWSEMQARGLAASRRAKVHLSSLWKLAFAQKRDLIQLWRQENSLSYRALRAVGEAWANGSVHGLVIDSKWRGVQGLFTWNGDFGV